MCPKPTSADLTVIEPPFRLMPEDEAFKQGPRDRLVLVVEGRDRFELELEVVGGPALVFVEDQLVGGHRQSDREPLDGLEGGLGAAVFIAVV